MPGFPVCFQQEPLYCILHTVRSGCTCSSCALVFPNFAGWLYSVKDFAKMTFVFWLPGAYTR